MEDWSARSEAQQKRRERERAYRERIAPHVQEYQKKQEQRRREGRQGRVRFWANLERRSPLAAERLPVAHRYILRPLQDRDFDALLIGVRTRAMENAQAKFLFLEYAAYFGITGDDGSVTRERLPRAMRRFIKPLTEGDWDDLVEGFISDRMADAVPRLR